MLKIKEYDVEDKEVYFIQEFYRDKYDKFENGIEYSVDANDKEIKSKRERIPWINILYKKCYLNKNHEMIKVGWLEEKID